MNPIIAGIFVLILGAAIVISLYVFAPELFNVSSNQEKKADVFLDAATWSGSNIVTGATKFSSGSELVSGNSYSFGPAELKLETTGDLVLYYNQTKIWGAGLSGAPSSKVRLRENNNLSVQDINSNELWSSKSLPGASPTANNPSTLVYNTVLKQIGILDSQNKLLWNSEFDKNNVILFELQKGKTLQFKDGIALVFNSNGNVEFVKNGYTVWDTISKGTRFILKGDNNLVLLNGNEIAWESGTSGTGTLDLRTSLKYNDTTGNFAVVDSLGKIIFTPDTTFYPVWSLDIGNAKDYSNGNVLSFEPNGNLILFKNRHTLWSSNTGGKGGVRLSLQNDNNLVLFDIKKNKVWESGSGARGSQDSKSTLKFNAGNAFNCLEIVDSNNLVVWRTPVVGYSSFVPGSSLSINQTIDLWWNAILKLEENGELIFYKDGNAKWFSKTANQGINRLDFVASQNSLVLFRDGTAVWGSSSTELGAIDNQTKLRFVDAKTRIEMIDSNGRIIWESSVDGK